MQYTLLILLLPLLSFVVLGLVDSKWKPKTAGAIGTMVLSIVTLLSYFTAWKYFSIANFSGAYAKIIPFNKMCIRDSLPFAQDTNTG